MKTPDGTMRRTGYLLFVLLISCALAACGGGGGGGTTSSPSTVSPAGPATVDISIAAADVTGSSAALVTVSGSDTVPSTDPAFLWPEQVTQFDQRIAYVHMDVVKVSLMPAEETFDGGDMNGEMQNGNSPDPAASPDKPHFITLVPDHPIPIDLLDLKKGRKFARFLNKFGQVPAGTYDKIRVYYQNVEVGLVGGGTIRFHPTANSKFDIHFRQGHELAIPPVTTDTSQKPVGWVKYFRVKLDVVGLKLRIVNGKKDWDKAKVILRPQIFAEFVPPILYSVAGTATITSKTPTSPVSGTFDVSFGTGLDYRNIHVAFNDDTTWAYSDNVLGDSLLVPSWTVDNVLNTMAVPAFNDNAKVMAIGPFDTDPSQLLHATDIIFSFPAVRQGKADNVWIPPDNTTFIIQSTDNVTVFPRPVRNGAYYDDLASPHDQLGYTDIDNNFCIRARGYFDDPGQTILSSYWISIGDLSPCP